MIASLVAEQQQQQEMVMSLMAQQQQEMIVSLVAQQQQMANGDGAMVSASDGNGGEGVMVAEVERLLGYKFQNPGLVVEALTHSSHSCGPSYQRLEFVGDAALGLAFANYLFLSQPDLGPGRLSTLRAANISTEKLARTAVRHGLFRFLRHNSIELAHMVNEFTISVTKEIEEDYVAYTYGGTIKAPKVLADIVESIAAAVYLDCGLNLDILWMVFREILEPIITSEAEQPVTNLYVLCQKTGRTVDIKNWKKGSINITNVFVDGQLLGIGTSEQKGIAKLNAARDALEKLWVAEPTNMELESCLMVTDGVGEEIEGSKQKLHELCSKNHWPKPVYKIEREDGPAHVKQFICSVQVQTPKDILVVVGDCRPRVKDAESSAASRLLHEVIRMRSSGGLS